MCVPLSPLESGPSRNERDVVRGWSSALRRSLSNDPKIKSSRPLPPPVFLNGKIVQGSSTTTRPGPGGKSWRPDLRVSYGVLILGRVQGRTHSHFLHSNHFPPELRRFLTGGSIPVSKRVNCPPPAPVTTSGLCRCRLSETPRLP